MDTKDDVLVETIDLEKLYTAHGSIAQSLWTGSQQHVRAVAGVNLQIRRGEILGLAGQSGCGKSTLGLMLSLLESPTKGTITFEGADISPLQGRALLAFRRKVQIVFQDPYQSLNPRFRVEEAVGEPLLIHHIGQSGSDRHEIVRKTLDTVELRPAERFMRKYPHELSGGERQRAAIARAIVVSPVFLVADEPVSMLDASVRAGILNLLLKLKDERHITFLFVTHDLSVARYVSDRLAVMHFGRIVELGPTEAVLQNPVHPYTRILIGSVLIPDPEARRPKLLATRAIPELPPGGAICTLATGCPEVTDACHAAQPHLVEVEPGHFVACHHALREDMQAR